MSTHAYQTVLVNSRDCKQLDSTGSRFYVELGQTIYPHPNSTMALTSLLVPHSWYPIREPYNTLLLEEFNGTDALFVNVTLTQGTYTVSEMDTLVATALNTASPSGWTYTWSTNTTTGRATVSVTGATTPQYARLVFTDTALNAHMILGQGRDSYITMNNGNGYSVPTDNFVVYSGVQTDFITIRCPQLEPAFISSRTGTRDNILLTYALQGSHGDIESVVPESLQHSPVHRPFSRIDFEILDQAGQHIVFNGQHIVMTLQLFCDYNSLLK